MMIVVDSSCGETFLKLEVTRVRYGARLDDPQFNRRCPKHPNPVRRSSENYASGAEHGPTPEFSGFLTKRKNASWTRSSY